MASGIEGSDDDALVTGEQDEELSRWEQEQIRKGINIPQVRRHFKSENKQTGFVVVVKVERTTVSLSSRSGVTVGIGVWSYIHRVVEETMSKFAFYSQTGGPMSSFSS